MDYHIKALKIREACLDANSNDLAITYNNLSQAYTKLKIYPQGLEYQEKCIKIWEYLNSKNNHNNNITVNLGTSYNNIATLYSY